jgi:hypothetical protein
MPQFTSFSRVRYYFNRFCNHNDNDNNDNTKTWFVERINGLRLWVNESPTTYEELEQKLKELFRLFGFQEDVEDIPDGYVITFE